MSMESIKDIWDAVCDDLSSSGNISKIGFDLWIKELTPVALRPDGFILSTYTGIRKEVIDSTYIPMIAESVRQIIGVETPVKIIVDDPEGKDTFNKKKEPLDNTFTFDSFIVGSTNRFAHAAAMAVAENPFIVYNPLVIYGKSGVGKTHLLFAIKNYRQKKFPNEKIIYVRGEEFLNQVVSHLRDNTMDLFHEEYRSADLLLLDDVHYISGKEQTQEEFYNTFDALYQSRKQIVLTLDRPPKEVSTLTERIRSRMESGLLADISSPDFETRVGIIRTKAEMLEISLDENIIYFIAEHIKTNTRQLEGVVKKLQMNIKLQNKQPTIPLVQGIIRDIVNDPKKEPVKIEQIVAEVARNFNVKESDILSNRKLSSIVWARQAAMYIAKETTDLSFKAIGEKFDKDHTTVLYSCKMVEERMRKAPIEKQVIEEIIKNVTGEE